MNDLINRSAMIEWFSPYMHEDEAIPPDVVILDIKAAPAVDAVEVVRCRDCKFYNNHALRDVVFDSDVCHWNADEQPDPDDYCSAGERKTE